jgi:hypothetical protein
MLGGSETGDLSQELALVLAEVFTEMGVVDG